jgi:hypothetical protein
MRRQVNDDDPLFACFSRGWDTRQEVGVADANPYGVVELVLRPKAGCADAFQAWFDGFVAANIHATRDGDNAQTA